jgi:outer membrane protein TolC
MRKFTLFALFILLAVNVSAQEAADRILTLEEYIQLAINNDTEFQEILIDELSLQYRKDLNLPARDIVFEVAAQYDLFLDLGREEPEGSMTLSKLFPLSGTEVEAEYSTAPSLTRSTNSSDFTFTISQPIAENAFGKATRLQDKILGVEIDVIRHQVTEAYEDYLAAVITAYYDWHEAYENLKIGESSYQENLKLMENIKQRQKSSIALPIDVNKITLQVLAKRETLIDLQEKYQNALNFIERSIRHDSGDVLIPQASQQYQSVNPQFEKDFQNFKENSRTYSILRLLEEKSTFEVDKNANELLPSIDLVIGYKVEGEDLEIKEEDNVFFAGVSMQWPFGDQVERAEYETSKIDKKKTELSTVNTHYRLYTDIKNLTQQIGREKKLLEIALEKIDLAKSVLEDETENYSFGKVTINDYIDAVNRLDNNRFDKVQHDALYNNLTVEWLRIMDQLISRKNIKTKMP